MIAFIENTLRGKVNGENFDKSIASCQTSPPSKFCAIRYCDGGINAFMHILATTMTVMSSGGFRGVARGAVAPPPAISENIKE